MPGRPAGNAGVKAAIGQWRETSSGGRAPAPCSEPPPLPCSPAAPGRGSERLRVLARNTFPFLVVGAIWEIVARSGVFPPVLFPTLETVASTFVRLTMSGILPHHALETLIRLIAGFSLAAVFGLIIGIAMGRCAERRGYASCRWSASSRPSPASPTRRYSCCGSARVISRRFCWSASSLPLRSSTTPGPV